MGMILKCTCGEAKDFVLHEKEGITVERLYSPSNGKWQLNDRKAEVKQRVDVYCRACKREWTIFNESHSTLVLESWGKQNG
jgi:hypothetical protein